MTDIPIEYKRRELKALCERDGAECLAPFGSALRDDFDLEKSDLNFSVKFSPVCPKRHAAVYFGLLEDLERLCSRTACGLGGDRAVHNPYLRQELEEREQILIGSCDRRQPEGVEV